MVGRDQELNTLELQIMKAVTGEGSVVNIIGEAGIGKSRLMAELKDREVMKKVVSLEGKAISMGRNLSYHPIISLLKDWARIKDDDNETVSLGKLEAAIRNVCEEDAETILPFVATLIGMKISDQYVQSIEGIKGEALQNHILKHLKDLLIQAALLTPLVIVMEDMHWSDISSIELLEALFRLTETQRIVFVNVFRPDHQETSDRVRDTLKDRSSIYSVEIGLEPFDVHMSETLINNMVNIKGLHHDVKDQIIQRSDGNPFFIEEVVRSFIDERAVVKKKSSFEVTEKINTMVIPQTINDVLMARIDRLEETTRNLVRVASVIGRNFFYRVLSEVSHTIEDIDSRLSYLKNIQLIRDRKRLGELEYLFKHALVQEAAYKSIQLGDRKALHLKVAASIEKIFKERLHEFYGMLAFHYTQAGDEEKIEEYLIKAGEEALKTSASSEALHYFHEALNLYLRKYGDIANPEKVAMLEKNIAHAYVYRGQFSEAVEHFSRALAIYGEDEFKVSISGILNISFRVLYFFAALYLPFIRWRETPSKKDSDINYLARQKTLCLSQIDVKRFAFDMFNHSKRVTYFDILKMEKGIDFFCAYSSLFSYGGISFRLSKKVLDVVKEKIDIKDPHSVLAYETNLLGHHYFSGDWESINEYNDELIQKNLKTIDIAVCTYIAWRFRAKTEQGRYEDARFLAERLYDIGNVYEHEYAMALKYHCNSFLLKKYRRLPEALQELDDGINFIKKTTFTLFLLALHAMKARIQLIMGDVHEADQTLQYASDIRSETNPPPLYENYYLRTHFIFNLLQLEKHIKQGNTERIATYSTITLKAGKKVVNSIQKSAADRVETWRLMGEYYWLVNKQKRALKWWGKAIKEGQRLGARLELSRTYFEVGKRLLESQSKYKSLNNINADEYLEKAKLMFEEMDLQWDLDELEKLGNRDHDT